MFAQGPFGTDPRDSGNHLPDGRAGSTSLGVTQTEYEKYVGHKVTWNDMRALTGKDVAPIYKQKYWDAVHADQLPPAVGHLAFDLGINSGPGTAARLLNQALGLPPATSISAQTIAAARAADQATLVNRFTQLKNNRYRSLRQCNIYCKGWLNRSADSLKVAQDIMAHPN